MNRYVVTLDAYVWAESDEKAREKSAEYANYLQRYGDNRAAVIGLCEQPFGKMYNRQIRI